MKSKSQEKTKEEKETFILRIKLSRTKKEQKQKSIIERYEKM